MDRGYRLDFAVVVENNSRLYGVKIDGTPTISR